MKVRDKYINIVVSALVTTHNNRRPLHAEIERGDGKGREAAIAFSKNCEGKLSPKSKLATILYKVELSRLEEVCTSVEVIDM